MAKICPKCGCENTDDAMACRACKVELGAASTEPGNPPPPATECRTCGQPNPPEQRFCVKCGADQQLASPQLAPDPFAAFLPRTPAPAATGKGVWIGVAALVLALVAGGAWWQGKFSDAAPVDSKAVPLASAPADLPASAPAQMQASAPADIQASAPAAMQTSAPPDMQASAPPEMMAFARPFMKASAPEDASAPSRVAAAQNAPESAAAVSPPSARANSAPPVAIPDRAIGAGTGRTARTLDPAEKEQLAKAKAERDAKAKAKAKVLREQRALAAQAEQDIARRRAEEARARVAPEAPSTAPRPVVTAPAPPAKPRTVAERCANRSAVAQGICEAAQCVGSEHADEAVCRRIRAADDRRRQQ